MDLDKDKILHDIQEVADKMRELAASLDKLYEDIKDGMDTADNDGDVI